MTEKMLTITEIATSAGLNVSLVRRWVSEGRLKATLYGKTWLITEAAWREFDAQRVKRVWSAKASQKGRPRKAKK